MSPIPDTFHVLVPRCQQYDGWDYTTVYRFSRDDGEDTWNVSKVINDVKPINCVQ